MLKLVSNVAAESLDRIAPRPIAMIAIVGAFALVAGAASADNGIDLSARADSSEMTEGETSAEGGCPELIRIKYPFLTCTNGLIDRPDANATWDNSRRIPMQVDFVEGDGYFGPDLNVEE
ncbi:MAG: hypothetical protein JRG86_05095 [Deltaproteobacteria bacterium]|jgi:hypothetical protein|nr:hypothetical protein [Deltaproteobacteria bacterium]MBW2499895.1 hypothetical protein [Deltaproteobacteria bacterium]